MNLFISAINSALFQYDTTKIVTINNKFVGFLNRVIQCAIVAYLIGLVLCESYI